MSCETEEHMAKKPPRAEPGDPTNTATASAAPASVERRARSRPPREVAGAEVPPLDASDTFAARREPADERPLDDPSDEQIRVRAFEIYLERGGSHGMDFDDWLQAEHELRSRR